MTKNQFFGQVDRKKEPSNKVIYSRLLKFTNKLISDLEDIGIWEI